MRPVRYVTIDVFSAAGYDARTIGDGMTAFLPSPGEMSDHWKRSHSAIAPKVAMLRGAILLSDGADLLPDGNSGMSFFLVNWRAKSRQRRSMSPVPRTMSR